MGEPRQRWWCHWSLVVPVAVLAVAAVLQGVAVFREVPQTRGLHLAAHVPTRLPGWRVRDLPLGANESVNAAVTKTLNYDEVAYREYQRGGLAVDVYVAYWGAGRMPTRLVASHTPDRCWTENGWTCQEMRFREPLTIDGRALQPAEWRRFLPPNGGSAVYVRYWHLIDGRVHDQGARFNAVPHPLYWWADAVDQALRGSREQYFIRITSTVPFDRFWDDPSFAPVLRGLENLGLAADKAVAAKQNP